MNQIFDLKIDLGPGHTYLFDLIKSMELLDFLTLILVKHFQVRTTLLTLSKNLRFLWNNLLISPLLRTNQMVHVIDIYVCLFSLFQIDVCVNLHRKTVQLISFLWFYNSLVNQSTIIMIMMMIMMITVKIPHSALPQIGPPKKVSLSK